MGLLSQSIRMEGTHSSQVLLRPWADFLTEAVCSPHSLLSPPHHGFGFFPYSPRRGALSLRPAQLSASSKEPPILG